eukprot:c7971_g1_i1 orf=262-489(-)
MAVSSDKITWETRNGHGNGETRFLKRPFPATMPSKHTIFILYCTFKSTRLHDTVLIFDPKSTTKIDSHLLKQHTH